MATMTVLRALSISSDDDMNNNDNNMLTLSEIDNALEQCDQEIETLHRSLDLVVDRQARLKQERERQQHRQQQEKAREQAAAHQRKHEQEALRQRQQDTVLEQQRQQQEQEEQNQQQQQSDAILAKEARIAELRRQIQEVEDATNAAKVTGKSATVVATTNTQTTAQVTKRVERESHHETAHSPATVVDIPNEHDLTASTAPTADPSKKKSSMWKSPWKKSKSQTATDSPPSPTATASTTASNKASSDAVTAKTKDDTNIHTEEGEVCKGQADAIKQKYQWQKPAWALPSDAATEDTDILTAPIQNGMLKEANRDQGYTRRVFAKNIHKVDGQFIASTKDAPPPRLAWIVVNLDGDKVGKIVMNLIDTSNNENVDRLVGEFLNLKSLAMERTKDGDLVVKDVVPQLVVTTKKAPKRRGKTNNVIGEVQEGQDVFDTVLKAGVDSIVTIKQAHIYPVKKAKGMFA